MSDEHLYSAAMKELKSGCIREGLWTKAMCECGFDEAKAPATYIPMVVAAMQWEERRAVVRSIFATWGSVAVRVAMKLVVWAVVVIVSGTVYTISTLK